MIDADRVAAAAHRGQLRAHGAAYVEHPRAVVRILRAFDDALGLDLPPETYAAALLHDVIEDSAMTSAHLASNVAPSVAPMVESLTKADVQSPSTKDDRDRQYYAGLKQAGDHVKLIKIADRVHNLSELHLRDDAARARRYLKGTREHVRPLATSLSNVRWRTAMEAIVDDAMAAAARASLLFEDVTEITRGLYAVVTAGAHASVDDVRTMVNAALVAGAPLVQIRPKDAPDRLALLFVEAAVDVAEGYRGRVVVNDRPDLALLAGADFVHLGQQDLLPASAAEVFRQCNRTLTYGRSTHSREELERAVAAERPDHANLGYVAVGPVHLSASKRGHASVIGVGALRDRILDFPDARICAVGGLTTAARIAEVAHAGATFAATLAGIDPRLTTDDGRHRRIDTVTRIDPLSPSEIHETRLRCRILQAVFAGAAAAKDLVS